MCKDTTTTTNPTAAPEDPKIVIIGSGPCGLGAAFRLQELGHSNFVMLDQASEAGGLARSDIDPEGFYWDYGKFLKPIVFGRLLVGRRFLTQVPPPRSFSQQAVTWCSVITRTSTR